MDNIHKIIPIPTGTRKFLNFKLTRYCRAIIGKASIKKRAFSCAKNSQGTRSLGNDAPGTNKEGIMAVSHIPILKSRKNCSSMTVITESFAKKSVVKRCGAVCSCFHVLFLYSSCVIRLVARMVPRGKRKIDIDSQELFHNVSQKSGALFVASSPLYLTSLAIRIMAGVKNAPMITSQEARLCFFFN